MKALLLSSVIISAGLFLIGCQSEHHHVRAVPSAPAAPPLPQPPPLGLADIKALVKAGVSDDVIISQIRNSHVAYHLTTAEILELKGSGVSEKIIDFMINTPNLVSSAPPATAPTETVVEATEAPPPPVVDYYPAPAPGFVWISGSWGWHGGRWVWAHGYWARPPHRHAYWVSGRWVHRPRGWVWVSGYWR